ncbi:MAG: hypothetical protein WAW86_05155 [Gammaproteobacteria bacterium]
MKKKILFGLALTTVISANSFALEITNGTLLDHKETIKGNIQGTFLSIKKDTAANTNKSFSPRNVESNYISGNMEIIKPKKDDAEVGSDITFTGFSKIYIWNGSSYKQTYTITKNADTCFFKSPDSFCQVETVSSIDVVSLSPGGSITDLSTPKVTKNYDIAGNGHAHFSANIIIENKTGIITEINIPGERKEFEIFDPKK